MAQVVVAIALLLVGQYLLRRYHQLERLLGVVVVAHVRVILLDLPSVGLLDLRRAGIFADAEDLVQLFGHTGLVSDCRMWVRVFNSVGWSARTTEWRTRPP